MCVLAGALQRHPGPAGGASVHPGSGLRAPPGGSAAEPSAPCSLAGPTGSAALRPALTPGTAQRCVGSGAGNRSELADILQCICTSFIYLFICFNFRLVKYEDSIKL